MGFRHPLLASYSPEVFKTLSRPIGHPLPEGEGNRERFTPHPSHFTYKKSAIRIIRDVGKAWFSDILQAGFAFAHTARMRKSAFTLAEVLITLGIIGVVAAMTLPGLVAKYKDKVMIAQVKKSYAAIQNAFNSAAFEMSGDTRNIASIFDNGDVVDAGKIIFKNMKVLKTCLPNTEGCTVDTVKFPKAQNDGYGKSRGVAMKPRYRVVLQDGSSVALNKFNNEGSCLTTFTNYETDSSGNYIFDVDGNRIPVVSQQYQCGQLIIDGNGMKGPNQLGADVFFFVIKPDRISSYLSDIDTVLLDEMLEYVDYTVGSDMN